MQKQTDDLNQQLESVRCKIINSYLTTIEDSFLENRPQLKLTAFFAVMRYSNNNERTNFLNVEGSLN